MSAQEHLARYLTEQLLGDNYMIVDKQPPAPSQASMLNEMDNTTDVTTGTLRLLADEACSEFIANPRHRVFVPHKS
jgi:hypothetical protein